MFAFVQTFPIVCLKIYPQIVCMEGCILTPLEFVWRFSAMYFQMCFQTALFSWGILTWSRDHIALCVRLNRKWELGIFTKMSTSPLIFLKLDYFSHNYLEIVLCSVSLLMHIWVQVEHGLLYRQVYTWISCNSSRLHAGCVWTYGDELNGALKGEVRRNFFIGPKFLSDPN